MMIALMVELWRGAPYILAAQYLDPGAGSIVIQVLVAGAVGVAAVTKFYWKRIVALFRRGDRRGRSET